ncbi:MAG TPA: SCO family protein [Rhizomicrobium sp.]|nr:SCO family protein [Rhizomicrobium sp.]
MKRLSFILLPAALILALIASWYLWHTGDAGLGQSVTTGTADIGGPFALVDQDGRTRTDRDYRGRSMLVYFGYATCPDVCPTTLALMSDAMAKLGADGGRVVPVFITIDPERDTSKALKAYLHAFGPQFVGLTGSADAIKKVADEYHVYYKKQPITGGGYAMDHSSVIFLMGPDGKFIGYWDDPAIGPDKLAAEMRSKL